jgi:hypothetical protein
MEPKPIKGDDGIVEKVEVSSPWFKLKIDDISWKTIVVLGMILASIVYLVKG